MWNPLLALVFIVQLASALHFYTVPGETRCFYEELTKGTVVIGKFDAYVNSKGDAYEAASNLKLAITVDVCIDCRPTMGVLLLTFIRKPLIMIIELSHKRVLQVVISHFLL